ncbi:MAG: O-antigen ligase family protein [Ardenticatenaceae bacterium]|nr:O-antigen ligase family protein [Ardenticatenaceae bacterium]
MLAKTIPSNLNHSHFLILSILSGLAIGILAWFVDSPAYLIMGILVALIGYLMVRNIEYGLVALIFVTYIRLSDVLIKFHGAPSIAKFLAVALMGIVLLRWVLFNEKPASWIKPAVYLGIYGLIGFASLLYADNSSRVINAVTDYGKDVIIAIVIIMILRRRETLNWVVWALLAAGIFLGTISSFQFLTGTFDNVYFGFAQAEVRNIVGQTADFRISGPISSNYFALILVALVPFALDRFWHARHLWLRGLAGFGLIVITFSLFFTYSRGGFIALVLVTVIMLAGRRPNAGTVVATLLIAAAVWQVVPAQYSERLLTIVNLFDTNIEAQQDSSIRGRYVETRAAFDMFADHPIRGVGLANYNNNYLDYAEHLGLVNRTEERSAHSLYLEIMAETGLIGLLAFFAILGNVFYGLRQAYLQFKEIGLTNEAYLTIAMSAALIGYLTGSIFLHLAYARYFWLLLGLGFAFQNVAKYEMARNQTISP